MNSLDRLVIVLLLGLLPWGGALAQKKPPEPTLSKAAIDSRLTNVKRLVYQSSGAQRIEASGRQEAMDARKKAMASLDAAQAAADGGDLAAAGKHLKSATAQMFMAIRKAGDGGILRKKKESDFASRAESVQVLNDALKRIAKEKGASAKAAKPLRKVEQHRQMAERLHKAGKIDKARTELDKAYNTATVAIESLRSGDTLVRSLSFANKEEEYHYELDRNDTHRMLITVLLEEKGETVRKMADTFVAKAAKLRTNAEKQAKGGDHAAAVKTLEQATSELVRAIRSAGVYIPG